MKIKIRIRTSQRKTIINKKAVGALAQKVLNYKGIHHAEVSIFFVGKQRIRTLNRKFRKIDKPTDVLAFSMRESKGPGLHSIRDPSKKQDRRLWRLISNGVHPEILGDIVICPEFAQSSAKIYNTTFKRELALYVIHGILHLLGYDDISTEERRGMEKEQATLLEKVSET